MSKAKKEKNKGANRKGECGTSVIDNGLVLEETRRKRLSGRKKGNTKLQKAMAKGKEKENHFFYGRNSTKVLWIVPFESKSGGNQTKKCGTGLRGGTKVI